MFLKLILLAGLAAVGSARRILFDDLALVWPERYSIGVTKMHLTSGLVEDVRTWKTETKSRIDYNKGAVKNIGFYTVDDDGDNITRKFEVFPTTDEAEQISTICNEMYVDPDEPELDVVLPSTEDLEFEAVGKDIVLDADTIKFEYKTTDENLMITMTMWAMQNTKDKDGGWIPIKYEVKKYNHIHAFLATHEIWEFYDFIIDFEEGDIFEIKKYNCSESNVFKMDSPAVTERLMFIDPDKPKHVDHVFNTFKAKYDRVYANRTEHQTRRSIFQSNMKLISTVNRKREGYRLAVNEFADQTFEEMKSRMGLLRRPKGAVGNVPFPYTSEQLQAVEEDLPKELDLRLNDLVTPVKNQETCGSCWTFGTTAAMEGAVARRNGGRLITLSQQAIVDCAWAFGAAGCNGGTDNAAYEWMMEYGIPTEEEYGPYLNQDGYCHILNMTKVYQLQGYTDVTPFSKSALKVAAVNHGPLSVSVEVTFLFQFYAEGIFYQKGCGPGDLNHEVSLVGYDEIDGELFWILKNSWGPNWGIDGYMHISARDNMCGVATEPTYPVL